MGDETEKFIGNLRGVQPGQRGEGAKGSLGLTMLGGCERGSWSEQSSDFPATGEGPSWAVWASYFFIWGRQMGPSCQQRGES